MFDEFHDYFRENRVEDKAIFLYKLFLFEKLLIRKEGCYDENV